MMLANALALGVQRRGGGASEPGEPFVANGGFDTDTDWTKGDGWTIAGGVAVGVPAELTSHLSQPIDLIAGNWTVDFDVVSRTAGAVQAFLDLTIAVGTMRNSAGHYQESFTSTGHTTFSMRKNAAFSGSIDNVVLTYLGP